MKSHVQDGEVVGLQADPNEPAPLEVRVVRPLPVEALTLNHVPCPVSPSLTAWRAACGFAQGCRVSCPVCWGEASPPVLSTMCLIPAFARLFPSGALRHGIRLAGFWGRQTGWCCEPLGQHCHMTMGSGLGLLEGRGHPNRAAPESLPSPRGLGLQRLRKSCWSRAESISSGSSLSG